MRQIDMRVSMVPSDLDIVKCFSMTMAPIATAATLVAVVIVWSDKPAPCHKTLHD